MRHRHSVSAAALIAALLAPGLAAAQPPGWTDPPAKAAAPETAKPEAAAPKSPAPAKPAGAAAAPSSAASPDDKAAAKRSIAAAKPPATTGQPAATAAKPAATAGESPARDAQRATPAVERSRATAEARAAHLEPRRHRTVQRAPARTPRPPETFAQVAPDSDARVADWAGTARHLTAAYLDSLSAPNAVTIAAAPRFYADRIQFHGRTMTLSALMQEKRRFTQRWPERRYVPETQGMRTACNAETATCTVRTPLAFSASNRARGVRSTGVAELVMTVSFAGGRPVIVAESSRVLRRGAATVGAVPASARGA